MSARQGFLVQPQIIFTPHLARSLFGYKKYFYSSLVELLALNPAEKMNVLRGLPVDTIPARCLSWMIVNKQKV